ncbi:MAG: histidinol-phosphatase [Eubacteriales bacterium]|nr:histidinol-phosphatase [Eubacteriales bacterium]
MRKNFHAHTPRCGHAIGQETEYVQAAVDSNYDEFGFSDHTPWPGVYSPGMRMETKELPDYVEAVQTVKEAYKDKIKVYCGLECEYYPENTDWLKDTIEEYGLEYIILGNHFDFVENSGLYFGNCKTEYDVKRYLKTTIAAMATGIYNWLAHPDLYLKEYRKFDDTAKKTAREICYASRNLNIPLEYNLLGLFSTKAGYFRGLGYPYQAFWEIAAEEKCHVILNVDAHDPKHVLNTALYDEGVANIKKLGLKMVNFTVDGFVEV